MVEAPKRTPDDTPSSLGRTVGAQEERKLKAKKQVARSIWFGFGMFGLIGWSIVVPTLLGTALGVWLDRHHPGKYSWTLMLMVTGLALGCLNAWHWVSREGKEIRTEEKEKGK
jgi:ATP synthase protein I